MKIYFCWISIILFLFLACKKAEQKPYWEEEKLVLVLADLRIIDNQIKKHNFSERDSIRSYYKAILYDIHDVTEEEVLYHLEYVQSEPDIAKEYEDKVIELLESRIKKFEDYE